MPSSDITNVMTAIVGNLMPVCAKEANPELWLIYDHMQTWALQSGSQLPQIDPRERVRTAKIITEHLNHLSDRKLARDIARVIQRHTPQLRQAAGMTA